MINPNDLEDVVALAKECGIKISTIRAIENGEKLTFYSIEHPRGLTIELLHSLAHAYSAKQSAADKAEIIHQKEMVKKFSALLDANMQLYELANNRAEKLSAKLAENQAEIEQMKQQIAMDTECIERIRTKALHLEVLNESLSAGLARYEQMEPVAWRYFNGYRIWRYYSKKEKEYMVERGESEKVFVPVFTHPKDK